MQTVKNTHLRNIFKLYNRKKFLIIFLLGITVIAYLYSFNNDFNNWDDYYYITGNKNIQLNKENIKLSFIKGETHGMYLPFTSLSFSLNHYFSGFNSIPYHVVNFFLHLLTVILVLWFVNYLTNNFTISFITSALFSLHTMQVESVAFVAGRRDILFTLFFLLSCVYYLKYIDTSKKKYYLFTLIAFIFSLFSKGQAVALPVILFILDFFRGKKILSRKSVLKKIPFFMLSIIFGFIAFNVKNVTDDFRVTADVFQQIPFYERIVLACYGICIYILKLLIPFNLSVIYPYPPEHGIDFLEKYWIYPVIIVVLVVLTYFLIKRNNKIISFGLLFFAANIFFVLQLVPNSYGIINEHYVYLPCIGIFFILSNGYNWILENKKKLIIIMRIFLMVYLIFLSVYTFNRCKVWKNSITLFSDVIKKHPDDVLSYINRSVAYSESGNIEAALRDYDKAIELNPKWAKSYNNRGVLKARIGDITGAIKDINTAISYAPANAEAYINRGNMKAMQKDFKGSVEDYNYSLLLKPNDSRVYFNRGISHLNMNDTSGACIDWQKALELGYEDAAQLIHQFCR